MALKPEHAKLSAYFNIDNGSGKIRGVYLQGNDMVRPIFEALAGAIPGHGRDHSHHPQHHRDRPPVLRRGGPARLPIHSGPVWSTTRARTTPTWTSTSGCRRPT